MAQGQTSTDDLNHPPIDYSFVHPSTYSISIHPSIYLKKRPSLYPSTADLYAQMPCVAANKPAGCSSLIRTADDRLPYQFPQLRSASYIQGTRLSCHHLHVHMWLTVRLASLVSFLVSVSSVYKIVQFLSWMDKFVDKQLPSTMSCYIMKVNTATVHPFILPIEKWSTVLVAIK